MQSKIHPYTALKKRQSVDPPKIQTFKIPNIIRDRFIESSIPRVTTQESLLFSSFVVVPRKYECCVGLIDVKKTAEFE